MNQFKNLGAREKLIVLLLIFVVVTYIAYSYVYTPLIDKETQLQTTISSEDSVANIEGLKQQKALTQESLDKVNAQVDSMINDGNGKTINRQDFLIFLGEKTNKYGVDLRRFNDMGVEEKNGSYRAKFELDLYGLLTDLQSIVNEIEGLGIGYNISNISIRRNDDKEWLIRSIDDINKNNWAEVTDDKTKVVDDKSNLSISDQKELEIQKKEEERLKLQEQVSNIQKAINGMTGTSNKNIIEEAINQVTDLSTQYTLLNLLNSKVKQLNDKDVNSENIFEQDKMLDLLINGKNEGNKGNTIIIPEIDLSVNEEGDKDVPEVKQASNKLDKMRMHFTIEFVMFKNPATEYNFAEAIADKDDNYRYVINTDGASLSKKEIKELINLSETFLDSEIKKVEGYVEKLKTDGGNTFKLEEYLEFLKSNKPEYESVINKNFTVSVDEKNYKDGYIQLNVDGVKDIDYSAIIKFNTKEVNLKGKTGNPLKIECGEDKDGFKIEVAIDYLETIEKHNLDYKPVN